MGSIEKELVGEWQLYYAPTHEMPNSLEEVKQKKIPCISAVVPGNVELDLYAQGLVPEPFMGANIYNFRRYEFYDWWYERSFTLDADFLRQGVELWLGGVDTYSTIFINGVCIGETDNMMMEYRFDTGECLRAGENNIAIHISSAVNTARNISVPVGTRGPSWEHTDEMISVRKPGHCFGWDIAPRFVSAGIWRGISLRPKKRTYIKETYLSTLSVSECEANILVKCRFATDDPYLEGFSLQISGRCEESYFEKELRVKFISDEISFTVKKPRLWWPRGYGDANCYEVTIELLQHGKVMDSITQQFGIRKVDIVTNFVSGDGGEFKVVVNDTPILCKGANWVPLDAFHSQDASRVEKALNLFVESGCNIVRCWGGNVYEDHQFYNICDANGIMVWQDFSLACAIYPQTDEFANVIEREAAAIVKKLRNHSSIILWSGDNEVDAMYYNFGYHHMHVRNNRISREILPRVTASHDPLRYFLPSSPYIPLHLQGDLNVPEQHNWGPRDYFKDDFYKHTSAHFISEIGYHGCPSVTSLKKFITEDKLWPIQNDEWDAHNTEYTPCIRDRGYDRNQLMVDQVTAKFGEECADLPQLALLSQISQAEAKKFFIEMVRLKKWRRTGIIWWNMLDCWPQISDAVVDYYFSKKLAFHYIKRSQQPICVLCDEPHNWHHDVVLCNDSRTSVQVTYVVKDGETNEVLLEGTALSPANENVVLGKFKTFAGVQRLVTMQWQGGSGGGANHFISGYPKFSSERYKKWLPIIAELDDSFNADECWR